nr:hypothetical protein Iba_chr12fCG8900 [Ipomoea batatas]
MPESHLGQKEAQLTQPPSTPPLHLTAVVPSSSGDRSSSWNQTYGEEGKSKVIERKPTLPSILDKDQCSPAPPSEDTTRWSTNQRQRAGEFRRVHFTGPKTLEQMLQKEAGGGKRQALALERKTPKFRSLIRIWANLYGEARLRRKEAIQEG